MATILNLAIPDGQKLWFYNLGGEVGTLLFAKDYDEAYAKAMALRLGGETDPEAVSENQRWFSENDTLEEVVAEYTGPAYAGELPEFDD